MEAGGAIFVPPPDVVQVPEAVSQESIGRVPVSSLPAPMAVAAAMTAPPPMVVRPRAVAEPESDTPSPQPVNPAAAAIETQQSLALPWRGGAAFAGATAAPDPVVAAPAIVAAPAPALVTGGAPAIAVPAAISEAPSVPSAIVRQRTAQPVQAAARSDPPARQVEATLKAARPEVARAKVAPADGARTESGRTERAQSETAIAGSGRAAAPARTMRRDDTTMVQFTAAGSQEAAFSFWQDLVHRFPDDLGQREPVVIRFEHDGMVFWRVRTEGFGGLSEAQTLCARMHAGGQDCYVARS
jgi:hypothetical protein